MLKLPHAEQSLWRTFYEQPVYPRLNGELKVDVAIVGAGITGLTTAYLLKQAGLTVAVLDKTTVGGGTTGRTTGKVTAQHGLIYQDLQQRLGAQVAQAYAQANQSAVKQVATIVQAEKLDCDWQADDNYVFTTDPRHLDYFRQEAKVAAKLELPASFETDSPLPFAIRGAVKFRGQAKLNAQKYVLGLARLVNGDGSHIFERSTVISIRQSRIRTMQGKISAKQVVVATNVPTLPLLARADYCLLEYPTESYIVAGRLRQPFSGMYISPDRDNYSVLPITVGQESWLLVGGESHISGLRGNKTHRYHRLADYAEERFGLTAISYHWSDRDYLSYDGPPLVGRLYPWSKNLYVASGFRKWGLSNGTASAMLLHDLILGKANPYAAVFSPQRLGPLKSIPHVAAQHLGLS